MTVGITTIAEYQNPEKENIQMATITKNRMMVLARQWAAFKIREEAIEEKRKALGVKLLVAMRRTGTAKIPVQDGRAVTHIIDKQRRPSKGDIVGFLGEEKGAELWASVPEKLSEYVSLSDPNKE